MNYKASKIFTFVLGSIFIVLGGAALLLAIFSIVRSGLSDFSFFLLLFGGPLFFAGLFGTMAQLRRLATFSTMTYDWYKANYPRSVHGNHLSCFACGGSRIHVRALMNRTFHREHFCTQCGQTLYYSPEPR